jgi:hypothetical protein
MVVFIRVKYERYINDKTEEIHRVRENYKVDDVRERMVPNRGD